MSTNPYIDFTLFGSARVVAEHNGLFLGEDLVGWRTALIAAAVAAIVYDLVMAATRRVTLRIPFLVLRLARLGMSRESWNQQYPEWKAELWSIIDRKGYWLLRFVQGMVWVLPLVVRARQVDMAGRESKSKNRINLERPPRYWGAIQTTILGIAIVMSELFLGALGAGLGQLMGRTWEGGLVGVGVGLLSLAVIWTLSFRSRRTGV